MRLARNPGVLFREQVARALGPGVSPWGPEVNGLSTLQGMLLMQMRFDPEGKEAENAAFERDAERVAEMDREEFGHLLEDDDGFYDEDPDTYF